MGQWYTYIPPCCFSVGRVLYLEEFLGLATFGVASALVWVCVAAVPSFSREEGGITTAIVAALLAIPSLWPRISDYRTARVPIKPVQDITLKAPPEIRRSELGIDTGGAFRDKDGRRVFLRGVNLSGSSKLPPGTTTLNIQEFASFVGKPFPIAEADQHLSRLRSAGFTFLRLLITWEAVEPRTQGVYDTEFLQYLTEVVRACGRHGISVVIDPHQDVWSRWTGGDGAPKWTLDKLGFDVDNFWNCRAAIVHAQCPELPKMSWSTNYMLYATATMFSLFFAGNDLVSNQVGAERVQDWLQNSFIQAMVEVAKVLKDEDNVLGFEPMNEPNAGWVGRWSGERPLTSYEAGLPLGWIISPWQSILACNGHSLRVPVFQAPMVYSHTEVVNPDGHTVWQKGVRDIWAENGLWDEQSRTLLKPDFFRIPDTDATTFEPFQQRYMVPFWQKFGDAIHAVMPDALIFTGPPVELEAPGSHQPGEILFPGKQVWSPHWYDGLTLINCRYRWWLGVDEKGLALGPWAQPAKSRGIRAVLSQRERMPSMVGEVGVPWMGAMTGRAMLSTMLALEDTAPDAVTLWNYTPEHDGRDDGWNREDLSVWSQGQWRMPEAIRPHVKRLAAGATEMRARYRPAQRSFRVEFTGGTAGSVTEVFIPAVHFTGGVKSQTSEGDELASNAELQTFLFTIGSHADADTRHFVVIESLGAQSVSRGDQRQRLHDEETAADANPSNHHYQV